MQVYDIGELPERVQGMTWSIIPIIQSNEKSYILLTPKY